MTERLFQRDSYLKTFDARVTAVRPEGVRLDRTAFFPTGGGGPGENRTPTRPPGPSPCVGTQGGRGGGPPTPLGARAPRGRSRGGGAARCPPPPPGRAPPPPPRPT